MATSVNRRSTSFVFLGTPATACSFGRAQQCIRAHAMRSRSVTESVTVLAERAPVAQLDRVPAFEAGCCRFESDRARHSYYCFFCSAISCATLEFGPTDSTKTIWLGLRYMRSGS